MQKNQVPDHALTLHLKAPDGSTAPYLRISVGAPVIEPRNGDLALAVTLSVVWGVNRPTEDNEIRMPLHGKFAQDPPQPPSPIKRETQIFRFPSRFRNWYLCERDGAEWSLEVEDPTCKDSCPICSGETNAIAVLGLPIGIREERPAEAESTFKLGRTRSLGVLSLPGTP
jgi:hypothetical protein